MMTKTKGVRIFAGVTSADLQVFAQRFCNGFRDWSRHRKSYSRSSVASGSLASARRLASMLLIQRFSGLNCGVPNAAKATSLRVVRSTVCEWRCPRPCNSLVTFQIAQRYRSGPPVCRPGDPVANTGATVEHSGQFEEPE
jgi:hypothetical protein